LRCVIVEERERIKCAAEEANHRIDSDVHDRIGSREPRQDD
jgi:hypothetical protein